MKTRDTFGQFNRWYY